MLIAALLAIGMLAAPVPDASAESAFDRLLDRIGAYVAAYQEGFTQLIASESFEQMMRDRGSVRFRRLDSEMFFVTLDDAGGAMTVRRVLRVDGQPVDAARGRIEDALRLPRTESRRALRALADEGARYNLGDLTRNFSDPSLALLFAGRAYRERFRFSDDGAGTIDARPVRRIVFRERERPTVIRDGRGGDFPASGTLFASDDGRIWRTELRLKKGSTEATLAVRYRHDETLDMLLPVALDEEYWYARTPRSPQIRINGRARYSNYRRFETSGRIISPVQE